MEYGSILPLSEQELERVIPHRRPFRFIDQILNVEFGKKAQAVLSDLRKPEYDYLKAHFPSYQLVPGVIIMEALAEVGAVAILGLPENRNRIAVLAGADKVRWRRQIIPGELVRLEAEITHLRSKFGRGYGRAFLEDKVAVEGIISFGIIDKPSFFNS
ncbi:MAG: 3R-hydroxymyristoyl ACP dehydrase [Microgenomates group bacterium Gr01-1014_80]|nr:MAG: 3R-hydroxymyristoyl ACP dehydrase [Microgenomates group bacterium Gr01-1014_80]